MAFSDPLWTECNVEVAAVLGQGLRDVLGRTRIDGAPQDDQRSVLEVRSDLLDGTLKDGHRWAKEFVDWRADDDDQDPRPADHRHVVRQFEAPSGQDLGE